MNFDPSKAIFFQVQSDYKNEPFVCRPFIVAVCPEDRTIRYLSSDCAVFRFEDVRFRCDIEHLTAFHLESVDADQRRAEAERVAKLKGEEPEPVMGIINIAPSVLDASALCHYLNAACRGVDTEVADYEYGYPTSAPLHEGRFPCNLVNSGLRASLEFHKHRLYAYFSDELDIPSYIWFLTVLYLDETDDPDSSEVRISDGQILAFDDLETATKFREMLVHYVNEARTRRVHMDKEVLEVFLQRQSEFHDDENPREEEEGEEPQDSVYTGTAADQTEVGLSVDGYEYQLQSISSSVTQDQISSRSGSVAFPSATSTTRARGRHGLRTRGAVHSDADATSDAYSTGNESTPLEALYQNHIAGSSGQGAGHVPTLEQVPEDAAEDGRIPIPENMLIMPGTYIDANMNIRSGDFIYGRVFLDHYLEGFRDPEQEGDLYLVEPIPEIREQVGDQFICTSNATIFTPDGQFVTRFEIEGKRKKSKKGKKGKKKAAGSGDPEAEAQQSSQAPEPTLMELAAPLNADGIPENLTQADIDEVMAQLPPEPPKPTMTEEEIIAEETTIANWRAAIEADRHLLSTTLETQLKSLANQLEQLYKQRAKAQQALEAEITAKQLQQLQSMGINKVYVKKAKNRPVISNTTESPMLSYMNLSITNQQQPQQPQQP